MRHAIGIVLMLTLFACGTDGKRGDPGADGEAGAQGEAGLPGVGCTVQQTSEGALISCADGTHAIALHGQCVHKKQK